MDLAIRADDGWLLPGYRMWGGQTLTGRCPVARTKIMADAAGSFDQDGEIILLASLVLRNLVVHFGRGIKPAEVKGAIGPGVS